MREFPFQRLSSVLMTRVFFFFFIRTFLILFYGLVLVSFMLRIESLLLQHLFALWMCVCVFFCDLEISSTEAGILCDRDINIYTQGRLTGVRVVNDSVQSNLQPAYAQMC